MSRLYSAVEDLKRKYVEYASETYPEPKDAANYLGVDDKTYYNLRKKYGIISINRQRRKFNSDKKNLNLFLKTGYATTAYKMSNFSGTYDYYVKKLRNYLTLDVYKLMKYRKNSLAVMQQKIANNEVLTDEEVFILKKLKQLNIIDNKGEIIC